MGDPCIFECHTCLITHTHHSITLGHFHSRTLHVSYIRFLPIIRHSLKFLCLQDEARVTCTYLIRNLFTRVLIILIATLGSMNDSPPLQYSSIDFDSIIGADVAINRNLSFDSIIVTNTISVRHDLVTVK